MNLDPKPSDGTNMLTAIHDTPSNKQAGKSRVQTNGTTNDSDDATKDNEQKPPAEPQGIKCPSSENLTPSASAKKTRLESLFAEGEKSFNVDWLMQLMGAFLHDKKMAWSIKIAWSINQK